MEPFKHPHLSAQELKLALHAESEAIEKTYRWLEEHMPPSFFKEVDAKTCILIARSILSFTLQDKFSQIHLKNTSFILTLDAPDADLRILSKIQSKAIRYYRAFVSNAPAPGEKKANLRIALVSFCDAKNEDPISESQKNELFLFSQQHNPSLRPSEFESLVQGFSPRFLRSLNGERLKIALELFFRAQTRDQCQYEIRRNEDWKCKEAPSLQLILSWRNVPKAGFLYRLARVIDAHKLALKKVAATYIAPYNVDNTLILSIGIHGRAGKAAWEEADLDELLREICLLKYYDSEDAVALTFNHLLTGNERHLVRNMISFAHQALVYADAYLYSFDNIVEGFCRHPELTVQICQAFQLKFHPEKHDLKSSSQVLEELSKLIEKLDTGQALNDTRRKNILKQALNFIQHTLKTNFYRNNKSAFSFRLDPAYLDCVPYDRKEKFPELPYGIFFIRGVQFLGFNIRFKDLARGGVRTVCPERMEQYLHERNNIFSEAYNLAFTQQKKNKDIPEGGAKTAILLRPFEVFAKEEAIYRNELEDEGLSSSKIEEKIQEYRQTHKQAFLFASQRSFIESLVTLVNCDEEGHLRAKSVVDYYKKPEYIYLGPDENMFNDMILWIANYAAQKGYKPGHSFMTSKPGAGINHKEFGVTSYGVNVYLHQTLLFLGINPDQDPFTIKISGGPDGDVAGNEILNLYKYYPKTAKLLALTDVSGTIFDPVGLDLKEMADLFHKSLSIRNYPAEKLHDGGFLLDLKTKKEESSYAQQTLLLKKKGNQVVQNWLSGNEMNQLYRTNVHQVKTDVFVPGGGRPRTLNEANYQSFLDEHDKPTSRAIVEGANLYLTPGARRILEKLGVLIMKDSSCNKGGVICSSFEVLAGLCMSEKAFIEQKTEYVKEVLEIIGKAALHEANLLLTTYKKTGDSPSGISDKISEQINFYKYQLLDFLESSPLPKDESNPLNQYLFRYCPPLLRQKYKKEILGMPDIHKKAIIACYLASRLVYSRGLEWSPGIGDILPSLSHDPALN